MLIAFSTDGKNPDARIHQRFGRAPGFLIVDTETEEFDYLSNSDNLSRPGGAGIQTSKLLADRGVKAVVSGNIGPSAHGTLSQAGIDIYSGVEGKISDILKKFKEESLKRTEAPNVRKHW